jgi:predicted Zn-dependent protease
VKTLWIDAARSHDSAQGRPETPSQVRTGRAIVLGSTKYSPKGTIMKIWKRAVAVATLLALCSTSVPLPAAAMSTSSEIQLGRQAARDVDAQNAMITDPVLNAWVTSMVDRLAQFRARPDINYQFKIVDTNDINAFSLPGGFTYVNFGLLNYVNSEDELAGVLGHEIGHTERRNQLSLQAKAQVLNLILGVASIFNPFIYRFGNLIGGAALYKFSRVDELQADQYGLLLMSRAGYDPTAMASFQYRLGKQYGESANGIEKYFADHPGSNDRVSHLLGYPELSQTNYDQILTQAIHDEDEGRYAFALTRFDAVLKAQPDNQLALLHKGQVELALGSFQKSQMALAQVAHDSSASAAAANAAQHEMSLLPDRQKSADVILHPNIEPVRTQLAATIAQAKADQTAVDERSKLAKDDLHRFDDRLNNLSYEIPNFGNVNVRPGSRVEGVIFDIYHMFKDLNLIFDKSSFLASESGGILKDDMGVLNEMDAPLHAKIITGDSLRLLPYYADINGQMRASSGELVSGITAARGAVALGWQAVPAMDKYFRKLDTLSMSFGGDISPRDAQDLKPLATDAETQLDAAAAAAETAQTMFYAAQARQVQSRITLLGLGYPEGRYDTLRHVIHYRLGKDAPTYDEALRLGISPGEVAAASWLAAEEKVPMSTVINEQRAVGKPWVDLALDKHLSMESMEVILGLMWEGYAEKPLPLPIASMPATSPAAASPPPG